MRHKMFKLAVVPFVVAGGISAGTTAASAHHSYSMFDRDKFVTMEGTVRSWVFGQPHSTMWIYVSDGKGGQALWGLESLGPAELIRRGFSKNSVKAGDKITVVINPLRDGRNGGALVDLTLPDGHVLRASNAGANNGPAARPGDPTNVPNGPPENR